MNSIKVIIPVAITHIEQVKLNIPFILKHNSNVSIIASNEVIRRLKNEYINFEYINEEDLGIDIQKICDFFNTNAKSIKRVGWYLQQFLKFNYANYYDDDYISFDADTIQLKPIQYKSENGEYIFNIKNEHNELYFLTIQQLFGNIKFLNKSFISEYMIFNSTYVKEMLNQIENKNDDIWYMSILKNVGHNQYGLSASLNGCGFSEFETYGTFMLNNYKDKMKFCTLNTCRYGRNLIGHIPTYDELIDMNLRYDTISFENW